MKRRDFIKNSIAASAPIVIGGLPIRAFASPIYNDIAKLGLDNDKILVLIQLNGGNDGLNTLIPLDQYSNLANARSQILIPEDKVLKLNDYTGLHPAMNEIYNLYQDGKVGIAQLVGYPEPNLSHFRSTDIWTSASDSNKIVNSGWLGRYLVDSHPDYPMDYPNDDYPDPLSITIGSVVSHTCQGPINNMGMAINSADEFYNIITGNFEQTPDTVFGDELAFVRQMIRQTQVYFDRISEVAKSGTNLSSKYISNNRLAQQLKIVARLINGGMQTKIYVVTLGGFDTHALQVDASDTTKGTHADLLLQLSQAVSAFQDDLSLMAIEDRVVGMTFSEFGRRIVSNSGYGSDHGTSAPLFIFGSQVNPVIHGNNPVIPSKVMTEDNLPMQFDFRSIYASVLKDWFSTDTQKVSELLYKDFPIMPLFKGTSSADNHNIGSDFRVDIYPNPLNTNGNILISSSGGSAQLELYDSNGRKVANIFRGNINNGESTFDFYSRDLKSGTYYLNVRLNSRALTKIITIVK